MPKSPSVPKLPPRKAVSQPAKTAVLESVKDEERKSYKRRRGYMSTVMTRGGLGAAQTQKAKVLGA